MKFSHSSLISIRWKKNLSIPHCFI